MGKTRDSLSPSSNYHQPTTVDVEHAVDACGMDADRLFGLLMPANTEPRTRRPYTSCDPRQQKLEQKERNKEASERNRRRWEQYDYNLEVARDLLQQKVLLYRNMLSSQVLETPLSPESALVASSPSDLEWDFEESIDEVFDYAHYTQTDPIREEGCVAVSCAEGVESAVLVILLYPLLCMLAVMQSFNIQSPSTLPQTSTSALNLMSMSASAQKAGMTSFLSCTSPLIAPRFRSPGLMIA